MKPRTQSEPDPTEPPDHLPEAVADVWREIVASNDLAGKVDRSALETFATLMARLREARNRVEDEGMVVTDPRGRVIPHPALAVERSTAEQIRAWGDRFAPLVKPVRKRGYMADATAQTLSEAKHLQGLKFAGPVAALKTLAWMIDEAQRDSMQALQKAMTTTVPTYLKACADLQITPASLPMGAAVAAAPAEPSGDEKKPEGSNVSDLQARAAARRAGERTG
ncbi:P27 family phage terminase small subunit [Pseudarthrobacter cellobiosi]|uniref:P27 family phage terminase small subunit n=1 Tax=Pseudarthrobacter cellobiosi TaxID=2953654 RepID=UPI00208EA766|nr:P27 family phage terminase small subunit [Pseudarthrobacter sp. HLT1-5]MCO4256500.1 P27 family phage terminase small subunit [Pseudarthrobacter sp. HLT1-5]